MKQTTTDKSMYVHQTVNVQYDTSSKKDRSTILGLNVVKYIFKDLTIINDDPL